MGRNDKIVYLANTEDLMFIEELNKAIENLDHEVSIVYSPNIPPQSLYRYVAGAKTIEKVDYNEGFDFPNGD